MMIPLLLLALAGAARAESGFKPELDCYRSSVRFAFKAFTPVFERDGSRLFIDAAGKRGVYGVTESQAAFFAFPSAFFKEGCAAPDCDAVPFHGRDTYLTTFRFPGGGAVDMTYGREGGRYFELNWRPLKDEHTRHVVEGVGADGALVADVLRKDLLANIKAMTLRDAQKELAGAEFHDRDHDERLRGSISAQNDRAVRSLAVCGAIDDADIKKAVAEKRAELKLSDRPNLTAPKIDPNRLFEPKL